MVKIEFFKLWFVLFYIYNHDVTFTLYINWTDFTQIMYMFNHCWIGLVSIVYEHISLQTVV